MNFSITKDELIGLNEHQLGAICETLMAGLFADGKVEQAEVLRFQAEATKIPWPVPENVVGILMTNAQAKVSGLKSQDQALAFVKNAAANLPTHELRAKTYYMLASIICADKNVTKEEEQVLMTFGTAFGLPPDEMGPIINMALTGG